MQTTLKRCLQKSMWVDKFTFISISMLLGIFRPKNTLWNTCTTGSNYFTMLVAACFWVWHSIQHTHIDKSGLVCKLVCCSEIIKNLRYGIGICLKGLRKTTQSLSQDGWCLGQDSKQALINTNQKHYCLSQLAVSQTSWSMVSAVKKPSLEGFTRASHSPNCASSEPTFDTDRDAKLAACCMIQSFLQGIMALVNH